MTSDLQMSREEVVAFRLRCEEAHRKAKSAGRLMRKARENAMLSKYQLLERINASPRVEHDARIELRTIDAWEEGRCVITPAWADVVSTEIGRDL